MDYDAVTGEEIEKVLKKIKTDSDYQYVIIDMDTNLDTINRNVFEAADQLLLVEKPGEIPNHKTEIFMKQVFVQEQKNKLLRLHNFAENNSAYVKETDIPVIGKIHNYGNLNFKNIIHAVNANGEYDIEKLLDNR